MCDLLEIKMDELSTATTKALSGQASAQSERAVAGRAAGQDNFNYAIVFSSIAVWLDTSNTTGRHIYVEAKGL